MLCQNCGKNEATSHIKQILNGEMSESHLCSNCAIHLGYNDMLFGFDFNLPQIFTELIGDILPSLSKKNEEKCPKCGSTFSEICSSGYVGCSECYKTFYDKLIDIIEKIHGSIIHTQAPANSSSDYNNEIKIKELKSKMDIAVKKMDFENAAKIRDELIALESGD